MIFRWNFNWILLTTIVCSHLQFYECRYIPGFRFAVYTIEFCPRSITEWNERSNQLNCKGDNSYACFPNEELTELLEFCYPLPRISIPKDLCLFLSKTRLDLESYKCTNFRYGCPEQPYAASTIFKYPSCVYIKNGCFLAEQSCESSSGKSTVRSIHQEQDKTSENNNYNWQHISLLVGVIAIILILKCPRFYIFERKIHGIKRKIRGKINKEDDNNANTHLMQDTTPFLYEACKRGMDSAVEALLRKGAPLNEHLLNGLTPLCVACERGRNSTVKLLLENGADVNVPKQNGASPLFIAIENERYDIVPILLDNGADVNICTNEAVSPLFKACEKSHVDTVKLLLEKRAEINRCSTKGLNSLLVACYFGNDPIVELLLTNDADVNICGENGASPFFIACRNGHENIARSLLSKGADPKLCRKMDNMSPFDIACREGHEHIKKLLKEIGADQSKIASF